MDNFLVTGASSGIGREVAARLLNRGNKVVLHGKTASKLQEAFPAESGFSGDLTEPGAAHRLANDSVKILGRLDCVVHCAGIGLIKPSLETTDSEFSKVLNTNTRATFLLAQAAGSIMSAQKKGLFITIPGILGKAVMKNAAAYIASKYAVTGMLKAMGQELQRSGVRFTLLHLGGVDTPFWDDLGMPVQRDKMISAAVASDLILQAIDLPGHLVLNELVIQPESHQL